MEFKKSAFGFRDKLGYLFGDFGNDFTFLLSASFLMKFYTDVMGVPGVIVGIVMMTARFLDAFTDVTMGRICDRSPETSEGKFRPWIRRMCGPVAIASFLIYQSGLAGMPLAFKVVWLFVTYILWGSIFYTAINIPFGSMASAISSEPADRQSLSTYRSLGGSLAGLVIGAGVPMFAYDTVAGKTVLSGRKFTMIAGVFSLLAVGCYLLCYYLTTERVRTEPDALAAKRNSVSEMLKNALSQRSLLSLVAASVVMLLAQLTVQSMANYVYPNYYGNTKAQSVSTVLMVAAMFLTAGIVRPLVVRFGKAEVSVAANLVAAAVNFFLFLIRPQNVWVYVVISGFSWLGLGIYSMVSWALVTDVIDDAELQNGIREDGSIYALYSFARKMGQAVSAGVSGLLLSMIGYSAETAFDERVLDGVYNISTLVPVVGFLALAAILWFWYPLHKSQVEENVQKLRQKHGQ